MTQPLLTNWEQDYPGDTPTLTVLREELTHTQTELNRARQNLAALRDSFPSHLPLHQWEPQLRAFEKDFKKQLSQAQRDFYRALKALQSAAKPLPAPKPAKPEPPPPPPPTPPAPLGLFQTTVVTVEDGQVISTTDLTAAKCIARDLFKTAALFHRQLHFPNALIPEPYAWVLEHNGVTYDPIEDITISYTSEAFERLCHLELDTHSPHLLDGPRSDYFRHIPQMEDYL